MGTLPLIHLPACIIPKLTNRRLLGLKILLYILLCLITEGTASRLGSPRMQGLYPKNKVSLDTHVEQTLASYMYISVFLEFLFMVDRKLVMETYIFET